MTARKRRIMLPLDGSRLAESSLPAGAELALGWGAVVTLLHVLEIQAPETIHGERHLGDPAEARAYLEGVATGLSDRGIEVATHVHEPGVPNVAEALAQHAAEIRPDLIVLCTHGSGGLRDLLLGNMAQQTLKRCVRPVLLVRPPAPAEGWSLGKNPWVVALEPAPHGTSALPLVTELTHALDVPIRLVTSVPTRATLPADRRAAATLSPRAASSLLDMEERDAATYLEEVAEKLREEGLQVSVDLARGEKVAEVLQLLDRWNGAVLVVATHRKSGIAGLVSGSFAVGAVGKTSRPVLLVPADDQGSTGR